MVNDSFIKCNYCKTNILLRFQLGKIDIPFDFCCPKCNVHIKGIRKIINENTLNIENATEIEENREQLNYYLDLSIELPHRKISRYESIEQIAADGFSPFMKMISLFESHDDYIKKVGYMHNFLSFRTNTWSKISPLYDLYFNNKLELIYEHLLKFSLYYTASNKLDVAMALHQLSTIGFNNILPENTLKEFTEFSIKIMAKEKFSKVYEFINVLKRKEDFDHNLKRLVKIYSRWIEDFEKYIPIVVISISGLREKFNKETYGIATTSFEDMISFYNKSYELILDMITIAIGLNNIFVRGSYNSFPKELNIKDFETYCKKVKSDRLNSLILEEPFSKYINMDRHVRNAIAHYNYDFNASSQKITFFDKHKDKENIVELYLSELAYLCYDNIVILVYLNELLYNLRKIDFLIDGMKPHIRFTS